MRSKQQTVFTNTACAVVLSALHRCQSASTSVRGLFFEHFTHTRRTRTSRGDKLPTPKDLIDTVRDLVTASGLKLILEPGRSMIATSCALVNTVRPSATDGAPNRGRQGLGDCVACGRVTACCSVRAAGLV